MRIFVDRGRCTGQGMCEALVPDLFEVDDGGVLALKADVPPEGRLAEVEEAVACCPNVALRLER
ncbi:ferredoxin [Amycolatopsis thermoflava]|uniref:ferredoxin n=1 Tax=Amycolatopsis thermoflava TaxID=84480 RepID=UPI0038221833